MHETKLNNCFCRVRVPVCMPLLPTARAVEAYSLRNAEDFAYMKEGRTALGALGSAWQSCSGCCCPASFTAWWRVGMGALFTAGDFGPRYLQHFSAAGGSGASAEVPDAHQRRRPGAHRDSTR